MQANAEPELRMLPAVEIETTAGTQARAEDEKRAKKAVKQIATDIKDNIYFDPIDVFAEKGSERYVLAHGFHRLRGRIDAGFETIECRIHEGGVRDALEFSIESNHAHGLPRTDADKRNAVNLTLDDPEWSQLGNRGIARKCNVSHGYVAKVREDRDLGYRDGVPRKNKATSTQSLDEVTAANSEIGGNATTHARDQEKFASKNNEKEAAKLQPTDVPELQPAPRRLPRTGREKNRDDAIDGGNEMVTSWPESVEDLAEFDNYANIGLMRRIRVFADDYIRAYMKEQHVRRQTNGTDVAFI